MVTWFLKIDIEVGKWGKCASYFFQGIKIKLSHTHKFLWISKPKTGSTSYRKFLNRHAESRTKELRVLHDHARLAEFKRLFEDRGWNFDEYYKVCASRNPWDVVVSLFAYSKPDITGIYTWSKSKHYQAHNLMTFEEWIFRKKSHNLLRNYHRLELYTHSEAGECLADLIFPIDTPEIFFAGMKRHCLLNLPKDKLLRLNESEKSPELLTQVARCFSSLEIEDMMQEIFHYEINLFNYKNPHLNT